MFWRNYRILRIAGIDVQINVSWLILALLVAWALALDYFPEAYADWSTATYWLTAIMGVIGFGSSLLVHELAHSLVARAHGIELRSITLFIFGGAAELENEPRDARSELFMAAAGPAASFALALVFAIAQEAGAWASWPEPMIALARYLAMFNLVLGFFNLAPAFPMDGGRILRAALWALWGDLRRATRWASHSGMVFGAGLMALGVALLAFGAFGVGFWWLLIGFFIRTAAQSSIGEFETRRIAEVIGVGALVMPRSSPVEETAPVGHVIEERMLRLHADRLPVVDDKGLLLGVVSVADIRQVSREDRASVAIGRLARECPAVTLVEANMSAANALAHMQRTGSQYVVVRAGNAILGTLTLQDLLEAISIRLELETAAVPARPDSRKTIGGAPAFRITS